MSTMKCKREGCENEVHGRSDKLYCSDSCRSIAHREEIREELMNAIRKAVNARVRL